MHELEAAPPTLLRGMLARSRSLVRFDRNGTSEAVEDKPRLGSHGVRALLYDAKNGDRELQLDEIDVRALDDSLLLWIDVVDSEPIEPATTSLGLTSETIARIAQTPRAADLHVHETYIHVVVVAAKRTELGYEPAALHCIAGENWVLTVHDSAVDLHERFDERINGDSELGRLDAGGFVAALLHEHLASYLREIEPFELELDRLDVEIMSGRADDSAVFRELVAIRRQLARLRRLLSPHRELYGLLARPDFQLLSRATASQGFTSLTDQIERTMETLETTREMIVNSFDVYMTWTAHATNRVMKLLTVASATLLPPTLLASTMGMNSLPHVLSSGAAFVFTVMLMLGLVAAVLGAAHWRGWV